jgi:hypothetical protein
MVDVGSLASKQADAKVLAQELGLTFKELTPVELSRWGQSFERQFVLQYEYRDIVEMLWRRQKELLLGAMIAKEQMSAEIDGESPASGKVGGPLVIRAGYLGIGDDWEDASPFATSSPQNWIHSGTTLLGGTPGNPIRVLENAVFVVVGIGTYHPSPKIEAIKFTIDGKEKPTLTTGWALKKSGLAVREFDSAYIWKKNTTVLAKVFISGAFGTSAADYPFLIGAAYIPEAQLRIQDPYDLVGTSSARSVNKIIDVT